jgi:type I restriction enzyme S subunit
MQTELPTSWRVVPIGEIAREVSQRNPGEGELPVLSITKHTGFVPSLEYFSKQVFSRNTGTYKVVRRGQFAYATIHLDEGSIDLLESVDAGLISPMYTVFEPIPVMVDSVFLRYRMKSADFIQMYGSLGQGSINRRKSISFRTLSNLRVPLPPLPEQRKIAAILGSVDEAIRTTQAVIQQARTVNQGLLRALLTQGIGHTRFKQTEVGEVPEEWRVQTIASACSVVNSGRLPINATERGKMKGPYPYYGPTGVVDHINEYRYDGTYVLIGEDGDHFLKFRKWSMTQRVEGKFNVNNHVHVLRGVNGCSTEWLFHYFRHRDIVPYLTRQGATRYKLNKATLLELPLAVPPLDEQRRICAVLDAVDAAVSRSCAELEHLTTLKRGLLQDLLTGHVRVSVD